MQNAYNQAALFVDFENIYYFIRNRTTDLADASEAAISTVRNLRYKLTDDYQSQCIVQHAYSDFERLGGSSQGAFYLIGIETHNVLSTEHKNAADMRLCIDAMETLYTRPEIETFVLIAGDRDYIPLVQHLRKHAKTVRVVAFKDNMSGDLLKVADEANFIDANDLLPEGVVLGEERRTLFPEKASSSSQAAKVQKAQPVPVPLPVLKPEFKPIRPFTTAGEREAMKIMLEHFGDKQEIWMSPYLYKMRGGMMSLAEYERRAIINDLVSKGAITVKTRQGDENDYSVILVNYNHPDVQEQMP